MTPINNPKYNCDQSTARKFVAQHLNISNIEEIEPVDLEDLMLSSASIYLLKDVHQSVLLKVKSQCKCEENLEDLAGYVKQFAFWIPQQQVLVFVIQLLNQVRIVQFEYMKEFKWITDHPAIKIH